MQDAQRVFVELSTSGPKTERAWGYLGLGNAYRDLEGPEEAGPRRHCARRPKAAPGWSSHGKNLGDIALQRGRLESALADYQPAVKLIDRPDHGAVRPDMAGNTRQRLIGGN